MKDNVSPFPSYKKPPVTEVVLGVQFEEIRNFNTLHYGLYRERIAKKYPTFKDQPPLQSSLECFGEERVSQNIPTISSIPPLRRCWFMEEKKNRLVQLDPEHYYYNWRKIIGNEIYPRYESIKEEFIKLWKDFLIFSKDIGEIKSNQWEVTYVNHIDKNIGWVNLKDLKNIFSQWTGNTTEDYLPLPKHIELKQIYEFPENKGRLHVVLQPAIRQKDSTECLLLKMIARGRLASNDPEIIAQHFDLGHEWIVRGFTDLTTVNAHKLWEREE